MNQYSFDIDDLKPFFVDKFKINIPKNLRPLLLSMYDLNLSEEELEEYKRYKNFLFQKNAPPKFPLNIVWLPGRSNPGNLSAEEEAIVDTYEKKYFELNKKNRIANDLFLKRGPIEEDRIKNIKLKNKLNVSPIIYWLANETGLKNQQRGLTIAGLRNLPEGVFQLGQEDSNTKGYFIYTSTSNKRQVRIRFELWNQYDRESNRSDERLNGLQLFFKNFEHFEEEAKEKIESMFLFFDEYVGTEVNIQLKNGKKIIKDRGFGRGPHINYDFFVELLNEIEIKTTSA